MLDKLDIMHHRKIPAVYAGGGGGGGKFLH